MRKVINILTGLFFTTFTAYHIFLFAQIEVNRFGRLLGIVVFLCFSAASFFALVPKTAFRIARTALLIAGLTFNFIFKLFNAQVVFSTLDFSYLPSILNCAVFIFSELGLLILLVYYLFFRLSMKKRSKRKAKTRKKLSAILMSVVILLFVLCLVMECVLLLRFNMNIDLGLNTTFVSRFLYCFAFVGMAIGFMLPNTESDLDESDYDSVAPDMIDKDFILSGSSGTKTKTEGRPALGEIDKDFVISGGQRVIPERDEKPALGEVDKDFIL